MKFVYVMVPPIVVGTVLLYLENDLSYCLQMWQYTIKKSNQQNSTYNHDHDILRLFENFPLTTSETKHEY